MKINVAGKNLYTFENSEQLLNDIFEYLFKWFFLCGFDSNQMKAMHKSIHVLLCIQVIYFNPAKSNPIRFKSHFSHHRYFCGDDIAIACCSLMAHIPSYSFYV